MMKERQRDKPETLISSLSQMAATAGTGIECDQEQGILHSVSPIAGRDSCTLVIFHCFSAAFVGSSIRSRIFGTPVATQNMGQGLPKQHFNSMHHNPFPTTTPSLSGKTTECDPRHSVVFPDKLVES